MNLLISRKNADFWVTLGFALFVSMYAAVFLINPQLGPTDDFVFLRTLQAGKPLLYYSGSFPYYNSIAQGRFTPLVATEYNLMALISNTPFFYFLFHAIEYLLLFFFFVKLLSLITKNKWLIYGIFTYLSLTPGFAVAWFRLQLDERNILLLFTIFLFNYLSFVKTKKSLYFIAAVISATLAIYYKETAFIAIGAFAFFHLVFSWKFTDLKTKILDYILIASSGLYLFLYYFIVYIRSHLQYIQSSPSILKLNSLSQFIGLIKNILNYALFSDPILLILIPLTLARIYKIVFKKDKPDAIFDSLLLASCLFAGAYFILGIYGPYYLIAIYTFALMPIIKFLTPEIKSGWLWKSVLAIVLFLSLFNVLPAGIHYITFYKYLSVNMNQTIDFMIKESALKHPNDKMNIFMDGVGLGTGRAAYFVFGEFMQYKGLTPDKFDLKSNADLEKPSPLGGRVPAPFTVFEKDIVSEIKSEDYLIVSPQSIKNATPEYLKSLGKDYELVFRTQSPLALDKIDLKSIVKNILIRILPEAQRKKFIVTENLAESPDYYVFIKK